MTQYQSNSKFSETKPKVENTSTKHSKECSEFKDLTKTIENGVNWCKHQKLKSTKVSEIYEKVGKRVRKDEKIVKKLITNTCITKNCNNRRIHNNGDVYICESCASQRNAALNASIKNLKQQYSNCSEITTFLDNAKEASSLKSKNSKLPSNYYQNIQTSLYVLQLKVNELRNLEKNDKKLHARCTIYHKGLSIIMEMTKKFKIYYNPWYDVLLHFINYAIDFLGIRQLWNSTNFALQQLKLLIQNMALPIFKFITTNFASLFCIAFGISIGVYVLNTTNGRQRTNGFLGGGIGMIIGGVLGVIGWSLGMFLAPIVVASMISLGFGSGTLIGAGLTPNDPQPPDGILPGADII